MTRFKALSNQELEQRKGMHCLKPSLVLIKQYFLLVYELLTG